MDKKFEEMTIHQKMELLIKDMVEREVLYRDGLREFQKIYIETALRKFKGNKSKMAESLGLHRNTLHNKAKTLKIKKY
jgi:DNA-binding NtrC family response regulator